MRDKVIGPVLIGHRLGLFAGITHSHRHAQPRCFRADDIPVQVIPDITGVFRKAAALRKSIVVYGGMGFPDQADTGLLHGAEIRPQLIPVEPVVHFLHPLTMPKV